MVDSTRAAEWAAVAPPASASCLRAAAEYCVKERVAAEPCERPRPNPQVVAAAAQPTSQGRRPCAWAAEHRQAERAAVAAPRGSRRAVAGVGRWSRPVAVAAPPLEAALALRRSG